MNPMDAGGLLGLCAGLHGSWLGSAWRPAGSSSMAHGGSHRRGAHTAGGLSL
jgi:hypothetical protein